MRPNLVAFHSKSTPTDRSQLKATRCSSPPLASVRVYAKKPAIPVVEWRVSWGMMPASNAKAGFVLAAGSFPSGAF